MHKYVDGIVFDDAKAEKWRLKTFRSGSLQPLILYRTESGQWIEEKERSGKGGYCKLKKRRVKKVAKLFTADNTDLPSLLIGDIAELIKKKQS